MAVIQTPKGKVIGLVVEDNKPIQQPKPAEKMPDDNNIFGEEQPKRGRPKKQ